jgi:PIN domain nuclease of toxin-antitoxin system
MTLLADTHTFMWFVDDNDKLSGEARRLLEDDNEIVLSIASLWEIAIKVSLDKLALPVPYQDFVTQQVTVNRIDILPVSVNHLSILTELPFLHRDPFDRLLVAQAIVENLPIIGTDPAFDS